MLSDLVFDVGAHYGNDTAHYLRRGFRVVGVEAHPGLAAALWDRFAPEVRSGRLVIEPVAVGPDQGEVPFYVVEGNDAVWSSVLPDEARKHRLPVREIRVPSVRSAGRRGRDGWSAAKTWTLNIEPRTPVHLCTSATLHQPPLTPHPLITNHFIRSTPSTSNK
ncbi:MAG: FkbM family methyltransferase [Candidatus Methylomirabilales bacterium]